jgi:hypothetical protein
MGTTGSHTVHMMFRASVLQASQIIREAQCMAADARECVQQCHETKKRIARQREILARQRSVTPMT